MKEILKYMHKIYAHYQKYKNLFVRDLETGGKTSPWQAFLACVAVIIFVFILKCQKVQNNC
jgi:hypothetical protein